MPAEGVRTYLADLAVPGGSLRLVLRLTDGGDASIDIPAQGIERMALEVTGGPGGALTMRIPVPVPAFMDLKEADGGLAGTFRQAAFSAPVSFRPGEPTKPRDPKPPLPYTVREVEVRHPAGHVLAGTLVVPPGASASARAPGVVFITGSGPQDRDESLMGHRPFLVIADALARRGIASLRCDDRGTGKSTGNFAAATSADFATDAAARRIASFCAFRMAAPSTPGPASRTTNAGRTPARPARDSSASAAIGPTIPPSLCPRSI
ncbi:MAG: alpha/beta hydrolase family protein, partial [Phycisphaerales bacterium]